MTDQEFAYLFGMPTAHEAPDPEFVRPWIDAEALNREIAEKSICEICESPMSFRSERGVSDGERCYRAIAVCTHCGDEFEF